MTAAHVPVNAPVSWGLGIGLQHSSQGECLRHWGSNPGSRSLMVIYPEAGRGIVVLTNSENGDRITYDLAARAPGGKAYWSTAGDDEN